MTFLSAEPLYKFNKPLKNIKVTEKEDATLECEVDDSNAEVRWFKNGKQLKSNDRVEFVIEGKKRRLVVKKSEISDEDEYECKTNSDNTKADLLVEPFNKIIKGLKDLHLLTKETATFEVEFKDPKAAVEWFKDNEPIHPGSRYDIKGTRGLHILTIKDLKLDDAGRYEARCLGLTSGATLKVDEGEASWVFCLSA